MISPAKAQQMAEIFRHMQHNGADPALAADVATGRKRVKTSSILAPDGAPVLALEDQNKIDRVYEQEIARRKYEGEFDKLKKREI